MNDFKLSNDINFTFSVRRPNGRKITRKEVVFALMALIANWEENEDDFLEKIYEDDPVQIMCGQGDKVVLFGMMFSDGFIARMASEMQEQMNEAAKNANAKKGGGAGDYEAEDETFPQETIDAITKLIEDEERKNGKL